MSEKKTTPHGPDIWIRRGSGLPFVGNSDDVAAQIVRDTYAHRKKFIAAICTYNFIPLVLTDNFSVNVTLREGVDDVVVEETELLTAQDMERAGQRALPTNHEDAQAPNPPRVPDFLLVLFAKSERSTAAVGCINELFSRECAKYGRARARRRYWAQTLKFLWPLFTRMIGRALKLAVIIDVIKRHFLG